MKATGSASGKVILLGEHLVVHGAPAIAAGLERGARAEASLLPDGSPSVLVLGGDSLVADPASSDDRARAFAALLAAGTPAPPVRIEASSDLPAGGGLGSSAALGVAIGRAVAAIRAAKAGASIVPGEAMDRATAWEKIFHGNPSGIDTAAAATGGCLRFSREGEGAARHAMVRPILTARDLPLCIAWSGSSSSTREMVEGVARFRERSPSVFDRTLGAVTALVQNAALALEAGDHAALGKLMNMNHMLLAGLFLSTEPIEEIRSLAEGRGALGAKLTGAGGGGSVIALVEDEAAAAPVLEAWAGRGYSGFFTWIRRPGGTS